ncbi:MAG: hypothetical protein IPJ85_15575 [Flavobacteriales bacterium]|nr:hypothetical protein [Flavobacteriales bacterium]
MRLITLLLLLLPFVHASAQDEGFRCLANNPEQLARQLAENPDALARAEAARTALKARLDGFERGGSGYIIPVVFHIVHNDGPENISDAQLYDAIRILNDDFNRQNPDWATVRPEFIDIVGDAGMEFRLAKRDPQGNCTNGITRTKSSRTNDGDFGDDAADPMAARPVHERMGCRQCQWRRGLHLLPGWLDGWPQADGIVILHTYTGSIGTGAPTVAVCSHMKWDIGSTSSIAGAIAMSQGRTTTASWMMK